MGTAWCRVPENGPLERWSTTGFGVSRGAGANVSASSRMSFIISSYMVTSRVREKIIWTPKKIYKNIFFKFIPSMW